MFRSGKKVIIGQDLFTQMQAYKRFTENQNERKALKRQLKAPIVRDLGDEWGSYGEGTKAVIDDIIYMATDRGYSFCGIETLAIKHNVSESTVKRSFRRLKGTGKVYVAYRKNPNGRGYKTPVVFFLEHPHFKYWKDLLNLPCDLVSDLVCEAEKPRETRDKNDKKVPTYGLPFNNFKRDNNIIHSKPTKKHKKNLFKPWINPKKDNLPKWMTTKQEASKERNLERERYLEDLLASL